MKNYLQDIEQFVQEDAFHAAEVILQAQKVYSLAEAEKNLWTSEVEDESGRFQVEVLLSSKQARAKIKDGSCDCNSEDNPCSHQVAVWILLRRKITEKAFAPKPSAAKKRTKLTLANIVAGADADKLRQFVREYARRDRQFSAMLRASLISEMDWPEPREKYQSILETAHKTASPRRLYLTKKGVEKYIKITDSLIAKAKNLFNAKNYRETLALLHAYLEKTLEILPGSEDSGQKLSEKIMESFSIQLEVAQSVIPPELKESIFDFNIQIFSGKLPPKIHSLYSWLFSVLVGLAEDTIREKRILEVLNDHLQKENPYGIHFQAYKLELLFRLDMEKEAEAFLETHAENAAVLFVGIEKALQGENVGTAKMLGEKGLNILEGIHPEDKVRFGEILLKIAVSENNPKEIIDYNKKLFILTHDFHFYDNLKSLTNRNERKDLIKIMKMQWEKSPADINLRNTTLRLFYEENQINLIWKYILKYKSIDMLVLYGEVLLESEGEKVLDLYEELINDFLQYNLGPPSLRRSEKLLNRLREIAPTHRYKPFIQSLKQNYHHRPFLKSVLLNY